MMADQSSAGQPTDLLSFIRFLGQLDAAVNQSVKRWVDEHPDEVAGVKQIVETTDKVFRDLHRWASDHQEEIAEAVEFLERARDLEWPLGPLPESDDNPKSEGAD